MPESIGQTLKKAREFRNLSIEEISERLRIPKKIISAIEEDKINETISPFYAKTFLKSYAQFLDALGENPVQEYLKATARKSETKVVLDSQKKGYQNWFIQHKRYIGVGVLVVCGAVILFFSAIQIKKYAGNFLKRQRNNIAVKSPDLQKKEPKILPLKLVSKKAVSIEKKEDFDLELIITSNNWVQVTSDGELLFKGLLRKGSRETWSAKKQIRLWASEAGGVSLMLDGKNLGVLGKKGEKKSNVLVTRDGLK